MLWDLLSTLLLVAAVQVVGWTYILLIFLGPLVVGLLAGQLFAIAIADWKGRDEAAFQGLSWCVTLTVWICMAWPLAYWGLMGGE
jgi:hypothetical protein